MTIRFAGASRSGNLAVRAWRCRSVALCAANDNTRLLADGTLLTAALRHFAVHGIAVAEHAGDLALAAALKGDEADCAHWLGICRLFDVRLAQRLEARSRGHRRATHG